MTSDIPPQLLTFASGTGLDAQEEEQELEREYVTLVASSAHAFTKVTYIKHKNKLAHHNGD